jgi:chlorobactene glucosyltransferase
MAFSVFAYLPALAVHYLPWPVFAAAIGQCLLFKQEAYAKIGGHATVKAQIADDMAFAYAIKQARLRFRMAEASQYLTCRMYQNWDEVRNGYAKNILAGHGNSLAFLAFSTIFHWWLFIIPWLMLIYSPLSKDSFLLPLALIFIGLLTRALTAAVTQQRLLDAILMPGSVILMTLIAFQGIQWHFSGGPEWKGRKLAG